GLADLDRAAGEAPLAAVRALHQEQPAVVDDHRGHARPDGLGLGPVGLDLHGGSQRTPTGLVISNAPRGGAHPAVAASAGGPGPSYWSPSRLKTGTGLRNPLSGSAPTGSAEIRRSTAPRTRPEIRIWPGFASPQSRKARLVTVPIAP